MNDAPLRPGSPRVGARVLELVGVHRHFQQAGRDLHVLRGCDLVLGAGETVGLLGPSGAGKSTLLHIAGLLERADSGAILIDGADCARLDEAARTAIRREKLGFVYQFHYLMAEFSALENVMVPQMIAGSSRRRARDRATAILSGLGLGARLDHRPARLSGGEQQRVAIARAVANGPRVILADEPTGNLDPETAGEVFRAVLDLVRTSGVAALIATHNLDLAGRMDRVVRLEEGRLVPS